MKPSRKTDYKKILTVMIFALAIVVRIFYGVATGPNERQHDWGGDNGHYAYVKTIAETGKLPDNNNWQNYHPPLTHLVLAGGYTVISHYTDDDNLKANLLQIIPMTYSIIMLFVVWLLLKEIGLKDKMLLLGFSLFAFHPTNIILSASLNNDMLTYLFFAVSMLFTVRWYKNPTFPNIIILGLSIALSMLSKFSGVMIAPITAVVFLVKLIKSKGKRGKLILQFAVFAAVCIPLGLSYTVRNYILFGQPLGYVAYMGDNNWQYIDLPFIKRLFGYYAPDFASPFSDAYRNNILSTCFKTSLFGEWGGHFKGWLIAENKELTDIAGWTVTAFGGLTAVISAVMSGVVLFSKKHNGMIKFILLGNAVLQIGFFIYFNFGYPFGCTADFRYLSAVLLSYSALIPMGLSSFDKKLQNAVITVLAAFCITSSAFVCFAG